MSPRKESVSEHSEKKSLQDAEILFKKARKRGQLDFSQFSKDEQKALSAWYEKNPENLHLDERLEFLEQCIANKIIDDKTLLSHIDKWKKILEESESDEAYNDAKYAIQTLGEYLAYMKNPAYIQSLWACIHEVPYQTQSDLVQYCTREKPELALLVAPLTDMSKLRVFISKKTGEQSVRRTNTLYRSGGMRVIESWSTLRREQDEEDHLFMEKFLNHFEDAKPFIESLLTFCERERKHLHDDSPAIENLRAVNKTFLFPYLKRIESLGLDTLIFPKERRYRPWEEKPDHEEEYKHPFRELFDPKNISYANPGDFLNKQEREEIQRIKKELIKRHPKLAQRMESDQSELLAVQEELSPEHLRRTLARISDEGKIRATRALIQGFRDYRHLLSEKEQDEFLLDCFEKEYPVFMALDLLDFPKERIADLFKKASRKAYGFPLDHLNASGEVRAALDYNAAHPGEPDLEQLVTTSLVKEFSTGADLSAQRLIQNLDVLSLFSLEHQKKIIKAIDAHIPYTWIDALSYAREHSSIPLHEILNSLADNANFLKHYHHILYHIQELTKQNIHTGVTVQDIRTYARELILTDMYVFFQHPQIVKEVFGDEEKQHAYIGSQLIPPTNPRFIFQILATPPFDEMYKEQCKTLLNHDPRLFRFGIESHLDVMQKLIGTKKILAYGIEKMTTEPDLTHRVFQDRSVYTELFLSQTRVTEILEKIHELKLYDLAVLLFSEIRSSLSGIAYKKRMKEKQTTLVPEKRLKELERLFLETIKKGCQYYCFPNFFAYPMPKYAVTGISYFCAARSISPRARL